MLSRSDALVKEIDRVHVSFVQRGLSSLSYGCASAYGHSGMQSFPTPKRLGNNFLDRYCPLSSGNSLLDVLRRRFFYGPGQVVTRQTCYARQRYFALLFRRSITPPSGSSCLTRWGVPSGRPIVASYSEATKKLVIASSAFLPFAVVCLLFWRDIDV